MNSSKSVCGIKPTSRDSVTCRYMSQAKDAKVPLADPIFRKKRIHAKQKTPGDLCGCTNPGAVTIVPV
jgi:hypothetical protein